MRYRDYPRPRGDTGRGIHSSPDWQNRYELGVLPKLTDMGIRWLMMLIGNDEVVSHGDIAGVVAAGIEPIIRIWPDPHWTRLGKYYRLDPNNPRCEFPPDFLRALAGEGVRYVRTGNEPYLFYEWDDGDRFASLWPAGYDAALEELLAFEIENGNRIRQAGMVPVLSDHSTMLDQGHPITLQSFLAYAKGRGKLGDLFTEPVAIGIHNRPLNRPANYPHDRPETWCDWPLPQAEWRNDRAYCFCQVDMYLDILKYYLPGREIPIIATEAGYEIPWRQDGRYPPMSIASHATMTIALDRYYRQRQLPALFANCFWHINRYEGMFAGEGWFENRVYMEGADLPVVQAFLDEGHTAWRDALFAGGGGPVEIPSWIVDYRAEVAHNTGLTRSEVRGIVVHHTGSRAPTGNQLAFLKAALDVGYHFFITAVGQIGYLIDISKVAWHAGDGRTGPWNTNGVGVAFEGILTGVGKPTSEQFAAFRRLRQWLLAQGVGAEVVPHKQVRVPQWSTDCPGDWWAKNAPCPQELIVEVPSSDSEIERLRRENAELLMVLADVAELIRPYGNT